MQLLKNQYQERQLFKNRLIIAIIVIALLTLALVGRLFFLQVIQHHYYTTLSKRNQIGLVPIAPQRGLIYDRHGVLLAKNVPVFSLMIEPDQTQHLKQSIAALNELIPLSPQELRSFYRELHQHRRFQKVPLKIKLTETQVAIFAVNSYRFPGFSVQAQLIREYPLSHTFAHVLGYVGRINLQELKTLDPSIYADTNYIGKTGVEKYYESLLHGSVGYQSIETDASGQTVRVLGLKPPVAGADLYLTIDSSLQLAAERALQNVKGAVIAMDPQTGQILAMASNPSFDPNLFVAGINQDDYNRLTHDTAHPLYNRSTHGLYPMGSTVKPFLALEGLESGVVTPATTITDPGWFKIPGTQHIFHDWLKTGHGLVDLKTAIARSCDTYFYTLAYHLGITPIDKILHAFGFGSLTGIDLPNELSGIVPSPTEKLRLTGHHWYPGDTVNTSIGQGFTQATPLQMAYATAILANRGQPKKPYVLYQISQHGKKFNYPSPAKLPLIQLRAPLNWEIIIDAMQEVIRSGTARYYFGKTPYSVAAKTGTAQVRSHRADDNQHTFTANDLSNALFIAFAPADHPKIVVVTVVEHLPEAAIGITRKMMDYYLNPRPLADDTALSAQPSL